MSTVRRTAFGSSSSASQRRRTCCSGRVRRALTRKRRRWRPRSTARGRFGRSEHPEILEQGRRPGDEPRRPVGHIGIGRREDQCRQAAEGRPIAGLALFGLQGQKTVAVALNQRLHHRMVGVVGLDQDPAGSLGPARTAGNLVQQMIGSLAGAQVAALQAQVGVDHAYQSQQREMVALGGELRADHDIELMRLNAADELRGLGGSVNAVRGHDLQACRREAPRDFLRQPLDPWADRRQSFGFATGRAGLRRSRCIAAVVADQASQETMLDQPG